MQRHRYAPGESRGIRLLASGAVALAAVVASVAAVAVTPASAAPTPFLSHFNNVDTVASTVPTTGPGMGDQNPYGVANVPFSIGNLVRGNTLVSNFNSSNNTQGTGTTIMQVAPSGQVSEFARSMPARCRVRAPGGVGLTTALSVLGDGYVVVGSLPVTNNGSGTPQAGCLIVLNSDGVPVETFAGAGIYGPWDMTSLQVFGPFAELFVTNVLNGTVAAGGSEVDHGSVVRLSVFDPPGRPPEFFASNVIETGFAEELNSSALVVGPTGVALGHNGTLYVADTVKNRITAVPFAASRFFQSSVGASR